MGNNTSRKQYSIALVDLICGSLIDFVFARVMSMSTKNGMLMADKYFGKSEMNHESKIK